LCGAFNTNIIKAAQVFLRQHEGKQLEMLVAGRKGRDFFRRRNMTISGEYIGLTGSGRVEYEEAVNVAHAVIKRFSEDKELDKVFIIYNEFKSVIQQRVVVEQLLPVARVEENADSAAPGREGAQGAQPLTLVDYIYEQSPEDIFSRLLPRFVETQIYRALLESIASEQGARMTAMDAASKNAGELINTLTLNMNRIRQARITTEIIEIVSGSAAAAR
jgi:F-type H+-transporting ATPase subunit gamma